MKHTKGPWHRNIRAQGKYPTVYAGRNTHVAQVMQQPTPEETEANIDLVAAAPELLEACAGGLEALLNETFGTNKTPWIESKIAALRAAIAKATGEQLP